MADNLYLVAFTIQPERETTTAKTQKKKKNYA